MRTEKTLVAKHGSAAAKAVLFATTLCLAITTSCGGSKEATESKEGAAQPAAAVWKPTGNEGTITGKVSFAGAAPKFKALAMDADSVCAAKHTGPVYPETVVANNGTLQNVFIHVKTGLEGKTFAVPEQPVTLDQDGCMYKPHVVGLQAGQNLRVVTSDKTTHNIHPMPKVNREWNVSQPPGADPIVRAFSRPEVSIPVKCNQHPWMRAYINVVSSPLYAVSGADGTFKIEGLPPGDYEIEALQEEYGAMTQKVTLGAKETKAVDFSYRAGQAFVPGSLKALPAMAIDCCGGN